MSAPILVWFRRDLRLSDHLALSKAAASGAPVIPVFILDEVVEAHGAAPKFRLGLGIEAFAKSLEKIGSRLILRRGPALETLRALVAETGAQAVYWSRAYDPDSVARDRPLKAGLKADGVSAESFTGHVFFEPWTVETKTGGFYKVYTPFWKAVSGSHLPEPLPEVVRLMAPLEWPHSENLADWHLDRDMRRGAAILSQHVCVGSAAALARLDHFLDGPVIDYDHARDFPAVPGTSRLSENLAYGEISPLQVWHRGQDALRQGAAGAETFLKEIVWREFAYHLAFHTPHITTQSWRPEWEAFPWAGDETDAALAWKQGRTGVEIVDAGMRELYVTGYMHNRVRMIVGSYLTKNLLTDWRVGLKWFEDCLIDWDPASNAMGWQWVAGCGPDAAPYFRVFNADTQAEKFDKQGLYRARFLPKANGVADGLASDFYQAVPRAWALSPADDARLPTVDLKAGRVRALEAYETFKKAAA